MSLLPLHLLALPARRPPMQITNDKSVSPVDSGKMLSPVTTDLTTPAQATGANNTSQADSVERARSKSSPNPLSQSTDQDEQAENGVPSQPVRIKTRRVSISSGFEYTSVLFNLRIDPTKWEEFSSDVAKASQLTSNDKAAIIATIAGFSILGVAGIGILVGDRVQDNKKLKRLMENRQEGGLLAQVVQSWNDNYFYKFGVRAWIEVNEAALRNQAKKSGEKAPEFVRSERSFVEKTPFVVFNKESWKRRKEEKKYMVVLSPLEHSVELDGTDPLIVEADSTTQALPELSSPTPCAEELPSSLLTELARDSSLPSTETSSLTDPFADSFAASFIDLPLYTEATAVHHRSKY